MDRYRTASNSRQPFLTVSIARVLSPLHLALLFSFSSLHLPVRGSRGGGAPGHVPSPLRVRAKTCGELYLSLKLPSWCPTVLNPSAMPRGGSNSCTMASSLRVSSGLLFSAARSSQPVSPSAAAHGQCRSFSKAPGLKARGISQNVSLEAPAQPSTKTRTRTLPWSVLPQDIGLLPGTFIRPLWRDMPSLFEQPRQRLHMEWLWLKSGFQNFLGWVSPSQKVWEWDISHSLGP